MKILLTGTIRVGKTTLLNQLKEQKLKECILIDEVARKLLEEKPELERKPDFQDVLFAEQTRQELYALSKNPSIIICDRGSIDIVAYSRFFGHPVKPDWLTWCRTYDKIFLLNKEDVLFTDNIIKADPQYAADRDWIDFRKSIERQIIDVLTELQISYTNLGGSIEQRFVNISKEMESFMTSLESGSFRRERAIG